jgi:hypothetical protein
MRVTVFTMPDGTEVAFAPHQRLALERAQRWTEHGFKLKKQAEGEPTFTDAEVAAGLLDGYAGLTSIHRPPLQLRVPNRPYNVSNARATAEIPCVSFEAALEYAWGLGCNIVLLPAADMERGFDMLAEQRGITLLLV